MRDDQAKAIAAVREHAAALGRPLDHLSDQAIEEGASRLAQVSARAGVTLDEAVVAYRMLARAVIPAEREREPGPRGKGNRTPLTR